MMACVSPALIVRSTPLRISLGASSLTTETCRSLISRVAMTNGSPGGLTKSVRGDGDVDENVAVTDVDGVDVDRFAGGWRGGRAGLQVEARPVQPALDPLAGDLALAQRHRGVRAQIRECVHPLAVAHQ